MPGGMNQSQAVGSLGDISKRVVSVEGVVPVPMSNRYNTPPVKRPGQHTRRNTMNLKKARCNINMNGTSWLLLRAKHDNESTLFATMQLRKELQHEKLLQIGIIKLRGIGITFKGTDLRIRRDCTNTNSNIVLYTEKDVTPDEGHMSNAND